MTSNSPAPDMAQKTEKPVPQFATLRNAMSASKGAFMSIGFFSFFINLLMLTGPLFMLQIYDRVLASRSLPTLFVLFALVAGLFFFMGFLEFIRSRILTRIGANIFQRIHKRVFDAVMHLSLHTGGNSSSSKPLHELSVLQQYISGPGPSSMFDSPWVPIYLFVIFLFHWWLGVLATVAAILLFIIALLNDLRARKPTARANLATSMGNRFAEAGCRNAEVLTALGMLGVIRQRWQHNELEALTHQTNARDRAGTLTSISKSLRLFLQSAMLAAGALLVIRQEITPGTMIAASIILGRALQPVEQAIVHWRGFVQARQAYHGLNELLTKIPPEKEKMPLPRPTGRLEVRGLYITSPNTKKMILSNINFGLPAGKILGIVGQSGAGKSTLARALMGVWAPVGGDVRIDDATFDQWDREILGQHLGYLSQGVELFGGKINENIARFQPDFHEHDIIRAAELAGVDRLIKHLGGYDADIDDMGSNLSAGQKQRIALARAMYKDPALVVLDEPNSNLDEIGDAALMSALLAMRNNGQTVIIITHRMNILNITDYILELHEGRQKDFGTRPDVIKRIIERNKQAISGSARQPAQRSPNQPSGEIKMTVGTAGWKPKEPGK
ncbi:MAG: type I secretion system permease/ATPase [bacterium]|nr:type I secretion system permease/ATPase [bacterium]